MSSLCGVGVRVRVNNFFSKTTSARDMQFFLNESLPIEDEKLFKAFRSVFRLFAITENVKILTQFHSFLIDGICTKSVFRLDDCRLLYI